MILAGDIGGTKTRLAVFPAGGSLHEPLREAVFASSGYRSLEDMVREFLARPGCAVDKVSSSNPFTRSHHEARSAVTGRNQRSTPSSP